MANFNQVILLGRLTNDPEVKQTGSTTITSFGIAVTERYNDRENNKQEEVNFFDVDSFGKKAELIGEHFKKGSEIFIQGRLKQNKWDDKDGNKRSKVTVRLDNFEFVGGRKNVEASDDSRESAPPTKPTTNQRKQNQKIPF